MVEDSFFALYREGCIHFTKKTYKTYVFLKNLFFLKNLPPGEFGGCGAALSDSGPRVFRVMWGFPENSGFPLLWGPYNKDPTI